jgi:hypothetical protein
MGEEAQERGGIDPLEGVFQPVLNFLREHHGEAIDRAYEYFWEEEYPEDFLGGTALEIAFINFEDWLVCDYRDPEEGQLMDLYIKEKGPDARTSQALRAMKESVISLYEVASSDGGVLLRDLLLGEEVPLDGQGPGELKAGDVFATRFIEMGGRRVMSRCVYPYSRKVKDRVLGYVEGQFKRYRKTKAPEGTMTEFLKDEGYIFNTIWVNSLFKLKWDTTR